MANKFSEMNRDRRKQIFRDIQKGGVGAFSKFIDDLYYQIEKDTYENVIIHGTEQMISIVEGKLRKVLHTQYRFGEQRQDKIIEALKPTLEDINIYASKSTVDTHIENRMPTNSEKQAYLIIACLQTYIKNLMYGSEADDNFELFTVPEINASLMKIVKELMHFDAQVELRMNDDHFNLLQHELSQRYLMMLTKKEQKDLPSEEYIELKKSDWWDMVEGVIEAGCRRCRFTNNQECTLRDAFMKTNIPVLHHSTPESICEYSMAWLDEGIVAAMNKRGLDVYDHECRHMKDTSVAIHYETKKNQWFMVDAEKQEKVSFCPFCGDRLPVIEDDFLYGDKVAIETEELIDKEGV